MTVPEHGAPTALERLRAAVRDLPEVDADATPTDGEAAADAERFDAVHEALVAVLSDVDRT